MVWNFVYTDSLKIFEASLLYGQHNLGLILYMIDLKNILYGFEKHSLPWQKHILFQRLLFLIVLCKSSIYLQILLLIIAIKISHYDTGCFCLYLWNFAHIILLIFSSLLLHSEGGFFFHFYPNGSEIVSPYDSHIEGSLPCYLVSHS